ncbi:CotS family spore coat protein [Clostridium faecium]|uniref:CotS family spore coat protein n=1 Tax=Clostridium faecium TaxID=2762223 RepID=A0ABR8YS93_9CLOT|nr:CotS family spore coat protein [Clostridium faecium]MBD8047125.1 CotS family spore coat protein [Clostridium faecium]
MIEGRFRDKDFLCEYDLDVELFNKYNYKVNDIIPIRKLFIISTSKGNKILKKLDYDLNQLDFIDRGIKYIKNNNFNNIFSFEKNKNGEIYTKYGNSYYVVMNLIEGRECAFNNPIEVSMAARALSKLHISSEGFRYKENNYRYMVGSLVDNLVRKKEELLIFKNLVGVYENKKEFDRVFIENVDYYIEEMNKSIGILNSSPYLKLCSEEDKIVLCHHDLAYHNILINDDKVYFIDFDYSIIDLRVHDLCNFINKVIKNFAFDFEKAKNILSCYEENIKLDNRELEVLYGMLYFPEEFYSVSKNYYKRKKSWSEEVFLFKLKRKLEYQEERKEFLEKFKNYYNIV